MFTVKELKEALKDVPDDIIVCTSGYSGRDVFSGVKPDTRIMDAIVTDTYGNGEIRCLRLVMLDNRNDLDTNIVKVIYI